MEINLNEYQKKAVNYDGKKPLLIEAGPGSGKTRVIIERVKFLINEKKIDPESLLVSTFSKKAATELKDRLAEDIDREIINQMQISTIHSFCYKLLRDNGVESLKIYDDDSGEMKNMFIKKNLKELGFVREKTATNSHISDIINKFNEYATFNVESDELIKYIQENSPVSEDYLDFIDREFEKGRFPRKKIKLDNKKKDKGHHYADSWYNARYLQTAKAYPKYIELLDKAGATDYNFIQIDAYKYLKEHPKTQYTNILVDEFQDTDPIQIKIFEILLKQAIANGGTFTAVGDIDQNIYGFRGAIDDYFEYLYTNYECERIPLNINYRSTEEIISLTEDFIKNQRSENSKKELIGSRDKNLDSFYLDSSSKEEEAENITQIIKYLKESKKINSYCDIAILYRSVKTSSNPLIECLKKEKIPYQVTGINDLIDKDEIKSIMTLLHFLVEEESKIPIVSQYEKEWLNLKAWTGENFNTELWQLSEDTKEILNNLQERWEEDLVNIQKEVIADERANGNKITAKRSFNGVFELDDEVLAKIFKRIEKPILTDENLIKYGITNRDDLEFFHKLNELKSNALNLEEIAINNKRIRDIKEKERNAKYDNDSTSNTEIIPPKHSDSLSNTQIVNTTEDIIDMEEKPETILEIYYRLLEITNFLDEDFINNEENIEKIENIAILTRTMYNYERMISKRDFTGFYWYLNSNLRNYGSSVESIDGVQLLTIHKSKGLEFPVTIISSLKKPIGRSRGFPNKFIDFSKEDMKYHNGSAIFYTPNYCLKDRNLSEKEEKEAHMKEEERIIYVGMTRAEDILILSNIVDENSERPEIIQKLIDNNPNLIKPLNNKNLKAIPQCEKQFKQEDENSLILSYTSLDKYYDCPFKYNLNYNFNFKISDNEYISYGNISHNALEEINKTYLENQKEGKTTNIETIQNTVKKMYDESENISKSQEDLEYVTENVLSYWQTYGENMNVLESEYPFEIKKENYTLTGFIDLIYETNDGIGILDYKTTGHVSDYKKEKYARQLYTYTIALAEDPKYKDKKVRELKIYAVKSKEMIDIPFTYDDIKSREEDMQEIVDGIINKEFPRKEGNECIFCKFSFICDNKNKKLI